jgi:class 3 adenylate cyclase
MADDATEKLIRSLMRVTKNVARGNYERLNEIFELTKSDRYPALISELAESVGMMVVKIEAREYQLERTIEELNEKKLELERVLRKVEILENIKKHLCSFVPDSVKRIIEISPDNPDFRKKKKDVSVVFLDLAGYTTLSERFETERMNLFIEMYFSSFLDDIHRNKGDINETAGDGLMIIFQDEDETNHATNAVNTALSIQERVRCINQDLDGHFQEFTVNVGINSGPALVGSTRFEGITGTRLTYTASGPVTNVAARIGKLARDGEILIGEETARRAQREFALEDLGLKTLKNVRKPVRVYRVLEENPSSQRIE